MGKKYICLVNGKYQEYGACSMGGKLTVPAKKNKCPVYIGSGSMFVCEEYDQAENGGVMHFYRKRRVNLFTRLMCVIGFGSYRFVNSKK